MLLWVVLLGFIGFTPAVRGVFATVALNTRPRRLQQEYIITPTKVRVADFSYWPYNASGNVAVKERQLKGTVNVTVSNRPVQYGSYDLGTEQVFELNRTIVTELVRSQIYAVFVAGCSCHVPCVV
jgi:hypothetical protein